MIYASLTPQRLVGLIVVVCTHAIEGRDSFPENLSFDDGFESIRESIEHQRTKLARADQLLEMNEQAMTHFLDGEIKLGANLMQDMEQVVKGRSPFAYPPELYRWPH